MHGFLGFRCHTQGAHTAVVGVIEFGELVLLTGTLKLLTGVEQTLELNLGHDSVGELNRSSVPSALTAYLQSLWDRTHSCTIILSILESRLMWEIDDSIDISNYAEFLDDEGPMDREENRSWLRCNDNWEPCECSSTDRLDDQRVI